MKEHSDNIDPAEATPELCDVYQVDEHAVEEVRLRLERTDTVEDAAFFSAFADPTRLRILRALAERDLCVCDLASIADVSQSAISHQLRFLRGLGIVDFERQGRMAVYSLASSDAARVLGCRSEADAEPTAFRGDTRR
jgi:ArsR family transcriptional regulator